MHAPAKTNGPRAATSYRGHVRNTWKAARRLPEWREQAAAIANQNTNLAGRSAQANGAREAAAKAMAGAEMGLPRDVVVASAMLDFYRKEKHARPVNRIIRALERQVRE